MKLSTNFTVAVHTLLCVLHFQKTDKVTSDFIAASTNMNPVIIRKILGKMHSAGLVETRAGVGGSTLLKSADKITLLDIYKAVSDKSDDERSVFNFHANPNNACPVGSKIHAALDKPLFNAQKALEAELSKTTLADLEKIIVGRTSCATMR
ncbi:Rrf2 family transcriptional regulator [Treponema pectinovorum]|uniref:Rrf2 family transcriptional regulator n=1 Tax=Treponema pectinovorum TaxID=164 RepID=UPI0011CC42D9|nr:Rrf2 family transcriptional regulator [Treponema pectinovorum]